MLKNLSLFLLLLISLQLAACSSGRNPEFYAAYPSVDELEKWYIAEIGRAPKMGDQYDLIKNPQGYFIVTREIRDKDWQDKHEPIMIWSSEKADFVLPSDEARSSLGQSSATGGRRRGSLLTTNAAQLDENIFYGYDEWPQEVIAELEGNNGKDARLWYGLGRAYSALGTSLLDGRMNAKKMHPYDASLDPAEFKEEDLDKYDDYFEKAIEAFEKAAELDPTLEAIVGNVVIKAANEHMTAWLDLNIIGQGERAKPYLKPDLYPAGFISTVKNMLSSSEQGGIIFTNGDNDTYPALYVQAQYGFRTDVRIVNLSLLNTARYIHYLKNLLPAENRLPITMAQDEYAGDANSFVKAENDSDIDVGAAPASFVAKEGDMPVSALPVKTRGGGPNRYFLKQDILLTHILKKNAWERPIYFADGVAPSSKLGLEKFCRNVGLISQITPFISNPPSAPISDPYRNQGGATWPDPNFKLFTQDFSYEGLGGLSDKKDENTYIIFLHSHQYRYHKLLEALYLAGDTARFGLAIDNYLKVLPPESKVAPSNMMATDGFLATKLGFASQADRLFKASEEIAEKALARIKKGEKLERRDLTSAALLASGLQQAYDLLDRSAESEEWQSKFQSLSEEFKKLN